MTVQCYKNKMHAAKLCENALKYNWGLSFVFQLVMIIYDTHNFTS